MVHENTLWVVLGCLAVLCVSSSSEIRFINVMQADLFAIPAETVHLNCQVYPANAVKYEWTQNGTVINRSGPRYLPHESSLIIREFDKDQDGGEFVCLVTSMQSGARLSSPPAFLQLLHYTSASIKVLKRDENNLELLCKVENVGPRLRSSIRWYRNHEEISSGNDYEIENTRLTIWLVDSQDNLGRFQCVAHSKAGMIVSTPVVFEGTDYHVVNVQQRRFHKKRSKDSESTVSVQEFEQVVLPCDHSQISEEMTVLWTKEGVVFRTSSVHGARLGDMHLDFNNDISLFREDSRIFISKINGSLIMNRISVPDEGAYECQLFDNRSNETIKKDRPFSLKVEQMLRFNPKPVSKKLELGNPGKLHCKAQGTPSPKVEWFRNSDEPLGSSADDLNGTLYFRDVSSEIEGNYSCVASSVQGTISATITVQVVMSPKFVIAPLGMIEAEQNKSVMLDCQATGDPLPTIQWDKDLKYLNLNSSDEEARYRVFENGSLLIAEVQDGDEGMYGCTIGNSAGLKREEVNVVIKSPDSAEMNLTITKAVILTMSLAAAYIILVIGLIMWFRVRRRRRKSAQLAENGEAGDVGTGLAGAGDEENGNESEPCVQPQDTTAETTKVDSTGGGNNVTRPVFSVNNFLIDRSCLTELVAIGRGEFGNVCICKIPLKEIRASRSGAKNGESNGSAENIIVQDDKKPALVIMHSQNKGEDLKLAFGQEMELFGSVQHRNVCRLYGVCTEVSPHYLVLEYTDWGDLKQFLLATSKKSKKESVPPLSVSQILSVAHQVSRGMDALTKQGFKHTDLAARNCVITSQLVVKISCPALSKDTYKDEYFKVNDRTLPVRWLAPEALHEPHSLKSDVFAFGVFVWELFTQATKLPHDSLTNDQVVE